MYLTLSIPGIKDVGLSLCVYMCIYVCVRACARVCVCVIFLFRSFLLSRSLRLSQGNVRVETIQ